MKNVSETKRRTRNFPSMSQEYYPSDRTFESIDTYRYFSADTALNRSQCHPAPYSTLLSDLKHEDKLDMMSSCIHFTDNLLVQTTRSPKWLEDLAMKLHQEEIK